MNDTIKICNKKNTQIIAHRGASAIELENTNAAFIAAGNRSYYGIECDVHRTKDAKFVIIHDDTTGRVSNFKYNARVEKSTYKHLRSIDLKGNRIDLKIPNLKEYISICKYYGKIAVLEIKNEMSKIDVLRICKEVKAQGYLSNTIFISFCFKNLEYVRQKYPNQAVQFLTGDLTDDIIEKVAEHKMDLDVHFESLNKQVIDNLHSKGIKVNCWTVDNVDTAQSLIDAGVDFITTNCLE